MTRHQSLHKALSGEAVIERVFEAPRELVWQAWTDPAQLAQWWSAEGLAIPRCIRDSDAGEVRLCLSTPGHGEPWACSVLHEVDPPARLVLGDCLVDKPGSRESPDRDRRREATAEIVASVTFEDLGNGKTRLILR